MGVFLAFFLAKYCDLTFAVVLGAVFMEFSRSENSQGESRPARRPAAYMPAGMN
jgi:hypothetical protein